MVFLVGWSGFSNLGHRNYQMEHSKVVYPDSKFGHSLDNFPHSAHVTDDCSKKVGMLTTHLLSNYYANFSFPSYPFYELK